MKLNKSTLKEEVDNYIRVARKYYKTGDTDYLEKMSRLRKNIESHNKFLQRVVTDSSWMCWDNKVSYEKFYEVIKILTGIDLKEDEGNEV